MARAQAGGRAGAISGARDHARARAWRPPRRQPRRGPDGGGGGVEDWWVGAQSRVRVIGAGDHCTLPRAPSPPPPPGAAGAAAGRRRPAGRPQPNRAQRLAARRAPRARRSPSQRGRRARARARRPAATRSTPCTSHAAWRACASWSRKRARRACRRGGGGGRAGGPRARVWRPRFSASPGGRFFPPRLTRAARPTDVHRHTPLQSARHMYPREIRIR